MAEMLMVDDRQFHHWFTLMRAVCLGRTLVQDLLYKFLFPSSKLIMESSQHSAESALSGFSPK